MRREERRLASVFRRALVAALCASPLAVAAASGCSSGGSAVTSSAGSGGAGGDGTGSSATGPSHDAGLDHDAGEADALDPCAVILLDPDQDASVSDAADAADSDASASDPCGYQLHLPCGLPPGITPRDNCYMAINDCQTVCQGIALNCRSINQYCVDGGVVVDPDSGALDIECSICNSGVGRVPAGLRAARERRARTRAGAFLATAAHLEAASVLAFQRLKRELGRLGAPARLVREARRAARDEVRHARVTGRLARRFGGSAEKARVTSMGARSLAEVALENAVEGCVKETFGALVARYQSERASDPEVAQALSVIAKDEARHAALSWAVARWATPKLDDATRALVAEGCRRAVEGLREQAREAPADLRASLGLPGLAAQRAMLDSLEGGLFEELWG